MNQALQIYSFALVALSIPVLAAPGKRAKITHPKKPAVSSVLIRANDFDHVLYLSKSQIFATYPDTSAGTYGWPGDGKHPGIPIYPVAKISAQLQWQVDEYNRMLHMAQEDIRMSEQVDEIDNKNNDIFNTAAANGDVADMNASTKQSHEIFTQMEKYSYDQETHIFKALGLHRALLGNSAFRRNYIEQERAVDFAHTTSLVQKTNGDELRFVILRSSSPPLQQDARSTTSSDTSFSELVQNTLKAVRSHQVNTTVSMTDVFNRIAEVDFSVQNLSANAIQFHTTPTMFYGNGLYSSMKIIRVSQLPMPSPVDQTTNVFAMASGGGRGVVSGEMPSPGEPETMQNSIIAPGTTLYVRASCNVYGDDHIPTKFMFQGGGWDLYSINVTSTGSP